MNKSFMGGFNILRRICAVAVGLAILWGCAKQEHGQLITPDDVAWIEKGVTTRMQVIERLGSPRFEVPLQSATTSTTTTTAGEDGTKQTTTILVEEPPKGTKATYLYTRVDAGSPFAGNVHSSQFWVRYDEHGVVQDYGFVGEVPSPSR